MEFHSVLYDQRTLRKYKGMFENRRVDLLLDGLKSKHFIGLKSNILCHPTLKNDSKATAAHVKYMVNRSP